VRPRLVIFAKAPRLGTVKTRLARDIGPVAALQFYVNTMRGITRRLARDPRWDTALAVTPGSGGWPGGVPRIAQGAGDLGDRMDRVVRTAPPGPVVIIGTDIPDIEPRHIADAFARLGDHQAVFGPADDGGYWLIGLRRRPFTPRLAGPVRWSTEHALADTRRLLGPCVTTAMLETLTDVDDGAGLVRWQNARRR
jgi:uncharacterized protein